jgi:uncharacterized protein DUF6152
MIRSAVLATVFTAISVPALAHHGPGTFELAKSVSYPNATITRIEFINPHSWLYFETTEPDGKVMKHRCEMRSAHTLRRSGWDPSMFKAGAQASIDASPDRADVASCYLNTIKFANGTRMDRYGQYVKAAAGEIKEVRGQVAPPDISKRAPRRPSGEPNITGDWAPEQVVMADPRGTGGGLVPLSTLKTIDEAGGPRRGGGGAGRGRGAAATGPRLYGGTELTEQGTKEAAAFQRSDNPRFSCQTTSILFDWTFDGPVNRITQNRDNIVIQYGQMGLKRTVDMKAKTHPANAKPTRAGHSIGRWENDVLIVDTVAFLPGVLNAPVRHSDRLHTVERFSLDPKTMKLTREYTAEDPVYLKGQYTGRDVVEVADQSFTEDHCKDQTLVDYSKVSQKK